MNIPQTKTDYFGNGQDGYLILEEHQVYELTRNMSFKGIDLTRGGTVKTNGYRLEVQEYVFYPEVGVTGGIDCRHE